MNGIWKNKKYFDFEISKDFQLTLGEGDTPLEEIEINGSKILIKREDLNPSKSFKDRTLAYQLSYYLSSGIENFCISSSGNAGISLMNFALKYLELNVIIFLGKNLSENKIKNISELSKISVDDIKNGISRGEVQVRNNIKLIFSNSPKSECILFANENNYQNLRASDDPIALIGYKSLGIELAEVDFDNLYILVSSATALLGMIEGIRAVNLKKSFEINIIQVPECYPMARVIDPEIKFHHENSEVNCIVDKVAKRSGEILNLSKNYEVNAQIVQNNDIMIIRNAISQLDISKCSANTLAPLAIWFRDNGKRIETKTKPLVIFSGI